MPKNDFKYVFILQLIGWGAYYVLAVGSHSLFIGGIHTNKIYFEQYNIFISTGFCLSFFLYFIYGYFKTKIRKQILFIPIILLTSFILTFIWIFFYRLGLENIISDNYTQLSGNTYLHSTFESLPVYLIWSAIYFLINYLIELREQKEITFRIEAALHQAKFNMLKYQVNPHFLFNSLNSIIGMIDEDKEKAKRMIEGLSGFFRLTLGKSSDSLISLAEEIEGVKNYLEIEKVRYEKNLNIKFNINEKAKKIKIPSFVIHSLIENAIKHGIKTSPMPLKISLFADVINHNLVIKVINSGRLFTGDGSESQSTNIGLKNVKERLAYLFPTSGKFTLYELNNEVTAEIFIRGVVE